MPKKLFTSLVIGGFVSALTLYLAFRNVPVSELVAYIKTIRYVWILPTVGILIATFLLRALRWKIILKDICEVSFWQSFHPTMIGFMMNCVLPGRVGELARPALLKQKQGVSISTGIATVAAERIFDLSVLILLFAFFFSSISDRPDLEGEYFGLHLSGQTVRTAAMGMIRLSIALLVFIACLSFSGTRGWIKKIIDAVGHIIAALIPPLKKRIQTLFALVIRIIDNFAIGLALVRNPAQLVLCSGITIAIWGLTALSYPVFAMGCPGIDLTVMEFTTVMVIICFVIALPSVPGFWGLWEAGGVFALSIYNIAEKDALGFTLVNHAVQVFPVIGIGLVSAWITSVNIMRLSHAGSAEAAQPKTEGV